MANLGSKHHNAKMDAAKVRQIRKSYDVRDNTGRRKHTLQSLGNKYGITPQSVHAIVHRVTWKHVK